VLDRPPDSLAPHDDAGEQAAAEQWDAPAGSSPTGDDEHGHADCADGTHRQRGAAQHDEPAFERAVRLFKALGDLKRLQLLELLVRGEACVTELAESTEEALPAISQRLRLLRAEGLVRPRRDGKHVFYSISDGHVAALVLSALDHAAELQS
jgi:ArsR family transcriptional regulator, lead/cadmium/zinc/bismuth-responsive transcriptional repressor